MIESSLRFFTPSLELELSLPHLLLPPLPHFGVLHEILMTIMASDIVHSIFSRVSEKSTE